MKKKVIIASLILILFAGVLIVILTNNVSDEFVVSENSKYTIVYATGENESEKSQINYIDFSGNLLEKSIVKNIIDRGGINFNILTGTYNAYTHDKIYFSGNKNTSIENNEMQSTYKFASENGVDEVYYSDYIEKYNMYLKHIPHGLSYDEQELGHFDLLVFYNENKTFNVRITESGSVVTNQEQGIVYNFTGEKKNYVDYDIIEFDDKKNEFSVSKNKVDLTYFFRENNLDDSAYFLGKTLLLGNKIYQIIHVGDETFKTYLVEYLINASTQDMTYQISHPINLESGDIISMDTTAVIDSDEIKYYSPIKPNKIITFNFKSKHFDYDMFLNATSIDGENPYIVREINDLIYIFESDIESEKFSIYTIDGDKNLKKLVNGKLPESNLLSEWWITDFYVHES